MKNIFLFTDQNGCYDVDGRQIPCNNLGQDGDQGGRPEKCLLASKDRFYQSNAVVHDTLSGYQWAQDANLAEYPLAWHEAQAFVAEMNANAYAGLSDWQLPSRHVLFSLISHQNVNPALPSGHPFENIFPGYYWTSETCSRLPEQAWYVHLGGGRVFRGMKHGSYLTWPVIIPERPDTTFPGERFAVDGPLAIDRQNKMTWLFEHDAFKDPLAWDEALRIVQKINRENYCGCDQWRMPTIRELESLVDINQHSPAVLPRLSYFEIKSGYWSSTTSVYEPRYAWVLYSRDGEVGVGFKRRPEFFTIALADALLV